VSNGRVHNSKRAPATMNDEGLADAKAANPFVYPEFTQELALPLLDRESPGDAAGADAQEHDRPDATGPALRNSNRNAPRDV